MSTPRSGSTAAKNIDDVMKRVIEILDRLSIRLRRIEKLPAVARRYKADASPVTIADEASHRYLSALLKHLIPIPVLSEEAPPSKQLLASQQSRYWLIDPLDGTKDFIEHTGEYAINVALIQDRVPVLGVIARPSSREIYYAIKGRGAFLKIGSAVTPLPARTASQLHLVASRQHLDSRVESFRQSVTANLTTLGSSLKFCALASGEAGVYPRFENLREWDVAAGHLLVQESGGGILTIDGVEPTYGNAPDFRCQPFLAWSAAVTPQLRKSLLAQARQLV